MSYRLGVDLGTTFSAAAVAHDGRAEMFSLESNVTATKEVAAGLLGPAPADTVPEVGSSETHGMLVKLQTPVSPESTS